MTDKRERLSNIELLRIIAFLMVAAMHTTGWYRFVNTTVGDYKWLYTTLFAEVSYASIGCFMLITGYFYESAKIRIKRVVLPLLAFLPIYYAVMWGFEYHHTGVIKPAIGLVSDLLRSGGLFGPMWYVQCLILITCLSPLFKLAIERCEKKTIQIAIIVMFAFFSVIPTINMAAGRAFFNQNLYSSEAATFVLLYFTGAYIKKYGIPDKIKTIHLCIAAAFFALLTPALNTWYCSRFSPLLWFNGALSYPFETYMGPFNDPRSIPWILQSLSLFALFTRIKPDAKPITARKTLIDKLASLTFGAYLIHYVYVYLLTGATQKLSIPIPYVIALPARWILCAVLSFATEWLRQYAALLIFDKSHPEETARARAVFLPRLRAYGYLALTFGLFVVLDVMFRYAYASYGSTSVIGVVPMAFTALWALLFTSIVYLLPRVCKRVLLAALSLFNCVLALTHGVLLNVLDRFFSFSALRFAGEGMAFFDITYLNVKKIAVAGVVFCAACAVFAIIKTPKERYTKRRVLIGLCSITVSVLGFIIVPATLLKNDRQNIAFNENEFNGRIYANFTDTKRSLLLTGLYQYTFRDFCLNFGVYDIFNYGEISKTENELTDYYNSKIPNGPNDMTGAFEGKNLILIQLEAIDTWLITPEYMPFTYALRQQSIDFTRNYAPLYLDAGTFNTENIVNTGLVSPFNNSSTKIFASNYYPYTLAHLMRDKGYSANSFHRSGAEVYSRGVIHHNYGYSEYFDAAAMGMASPNYDTELMKGYDLFVPKQEPFLSFIVTFAAHGPYLGSELSEVYWDFAQSVVPEGSNIMVYHAVAHAHDTDLFIQQLYERLEAEGRLDNTVLALYADHYDYYVLDRNIIKEQKHLDDDNLIQQTPLFIYSKGTAPTKITKVTSTIDILPTLANLFALDTDGRYYVGDDAFSKGGGYAIFLDNSWIDGDRYKNVNTPNNDEDNARAAEIAKRFQTSWDTMSIDYFRRVK